MKEKHRIKQDIYIERQAGHQDEDSAEWGNGAQS